jgi:CBS domain-containing protein
MRTDVPLIAPDDSVSHAWEWAGSHDAPVYLVGTSEYLVGSIPQERLAEAAASGRGDARVATLVDDEFIHAHPDHPIDVVLARFAQAGGVLPIVSRSAARRVEGVVTLESLARRRPRPNGSTGH